MSTDKEAKKKSKFLSYVLRHQPSLIGITLDERGWVNIELLLEKVKNFGNSLSFSELQSIVAKDSKNRFSFSEDKQMIRANQGHSVKIDLGYKAEQPPEVLYHGTAKKYLDAILKEGIQKRKRHHVHLSSDEATAKNVGSRHGAPIVLKIQTAKMHQDGIEFYLSENNVWLTDYVDPKYIEQDY